MSVYMTEEEQLDLIKRWWQRHSTLISVIFSVILLSVSAYKYWQWHENKLITQASNVFEHLMVAFSNKDNKAVSSYAKQLMNDYDDTIYAHAARLTMAKLYIAGSHFDKAEAALRYVAEHSPMNALKQIARIRIARLLTAQKMFDKALVELKEVNDTAYAPVINELKGDIYAATGKYQQAIVSYKEAMTAVHTQGMGNLYLEMKTNELAALNQSVNASNTVQQTV